MTTRWKALSYDKDSFSRTLKGKRQYRFKIQAFTIEKAFAAAEMWVKECPYGLLMLKGIEARNPLHRHMHNARRASDIGKLTFLFEYHEDTHV